MKSTKTSLFDIPVLPYIFKSIVKTRQNLLNFSIWNAYLYDIKSDMQLTSAIGNLQRLKYLIEQVKKKANW